MQNSENGEKTPVVDKPKTANSVYGAALQNWDTNNKSGIESFAGSKNS